MNQFQFPAINNELTGKHLREECAKKGLSPKDVRETLNIGSTQTVYDWFQGRSLPSLDNMVALAVLLDCSVEELVIYAAPGSERRKKKTGPRGKTE